MKFAAILALALPLFAWSGVTKGVKYQSYNIEHEPGTVLSVVLSKKVLTDGCNTYSLHTQFQNVQPADQTMALPKMLVDYHVLQTEMACEPTRQSVMKTISSEPMAFEHNHDTTTGMILLIPTDVTVRFVTNKK